MAGRGLLTGRVACERFSLATPRQLCVKQGLQRGELFPQGGVLHHREAHTRVCQ